LVKLYVLGLRTLSVIREALQAIERRHGRSIDMEDPDDVDLNDPKVLAAFTAHDYGGVFQYDTTSADKTCVGVEFSSFEDIAAMTALNRPGTSRSGLAAKYVQRKRDPKLVAKIDFHPEVSRITADTLGIIVYQEHVIRIFTDIAGFAPGTADKLRKVIAKKVGDETIGKERERFIAGAMEHTPGMTEDVAAKIIEAIQFFGCIPGRTHIATPSGARRIDSLKAGDELWSWAGKRVRNRIKTVGRSGLKWMTSIHFGSVVQEASSDHWWLMHDGTYKKTRDLEIGDRLSVGTELSYVNDDKDLLSGMHSEDSGEGSVRPMLPTGVSKNQDRSGQTGGLGAQQARGGIGQGLASRIGQERSGNCSASASDQRGSESGVAGREDSRLSESCAVSSETPQALPEVRCTSAAGASGAEHARVAWASQGSEQGEQRFVEHRTDLPTVPLEGTSGREGGRWLEVTRLTPGRLEETCDLECENEPANYVLANGLTSHNSYGFNKSHATAYGMIAHWCMWLKVYYPLEFYWALLKNEPDRVRVQQIARDAKRQGIPLLAPHVSVSGDQFTIDDEAGAIRGSLSDIKGVGDKASLTIREHQPYKDLFDFYDRIERRACHRGVVGSLVKAGAMTSLVPNRRWFAENLDSVWKRLGNPKQREALRAELKASKKAPNYTLEERTLMANQVNPLAFGKHPVDAYSKFMDEFLKVPIADMSSDTFVEDYANRNCFVAGMVVEARYNQIGDFHTGKAPTEEEKQWMFWGKRYANVNVEDRGGKQNRFRFDIDIFEDFRELIDKGIGTPMIVHALGLPVLHGALRAQLRAQFAVDLEAFRKRVRGGESLNLWERILVGRHPAWDYPWKDERTREARTSNAAFWEAKHNGMFTGVVTNVRLKYDKNHRKMAFFGLLAADLRFVDVIAFNSSWGEIQTAVKTGRLITIQLEGKRDHYRGFSHFYDGGRVKWLSKADSALPAAAE